MKLFTGLTLGLLGLTCAQQFGESTQSATATDFLADVDSVLAQIESGEVSVGQQGASAGLARMRGAGAVPDPILQQFAGRKLPPGIQLSDFAGGPNGFRTQAFLKALQAALRNQAEQQRLRQQQLAAQRQREALAAKAAKEAAEEAARLKAEQEATRKAAEEASQREAEEKAAADEAAKQAAEKAAEAEAKRIAAQQEQARQEALREAARNRARQQAAVAAAAQAARETAEAAEIDAAMNAQGASILSDTIASIMTDEEFFGANSGFNQGKFVSP